MHGADSGSRSKQSRGSFEEPSDEDDFGSSPIDYEYDDDMKSYQDDKSARYGRGITESPPRGRARIGSSSEDEKGLGIRGAHGSDDGAQSPPPKPPPHGTPPGGTPGSGRGTSQGGAGAYI